MIKLKKFLVKAVLTTNCLERLVKMEAKVLNGKELSTKIKEELKIEVEDLKKNNINPGTGRNNCG